MEFALASKYDMWVKPDDIDIAWFAGLFDGEGSIIIHKPSTTQSQYSYSLTIVSTDKDLIDRIQLIFPARVRQEKTSQIRFGTKPQFRWECTRMEYVRFIMIHIYPFLSERRRARWADALELRQQYAERSQIGG